MNWIIHLKIQFTSKNFQEMFEGTQQFWRVVWITPGWIDSNFFVRILIKFCGIIIGRICETIHVKIFKVTPERIVLKWHKVILKIFLKRLFKEFLCGLSKKILHGFSRKYNCRNIFLAIALRWLLMEKSVKLKEASKKTCKNFWENLRSDPFVGLSTTALKTFTRYDKINSLRLYLVKAFKRFY